MEHLEKLIATKPHFPVAMSTIDIAFYFLFFSIPLSWFFCVRFRRTGTIVQILLICLSISFVFIGIKFEKALSAYQNWEREASFFIKSQKQTSAKIDSAIYYNSKNEGQWIVDADIVYTLNKSKKEYKGPVEIAINSNAKQDIFSFIELKRKLSDTLPQGVYMPKIITNRLPSVMKEKISKIDNKNAFLTHVTESGYSVKVYYAFLIAEGFHLIFFIYNLIYLMGEYINRRSREEREFGQLIQVTRERDYWRMEAETLQEELNRVIGNTKENNEVKKETRVIRQ